MRTDGGIEDLEGLSSLPQVSRLLPVFYWTLNDFVPAGLPSTVTST